MDIDDFFDFSKPFERIPVAAPLIGSVVLPDPQFNIPNVKRPEFGTEYVMDHIKKEEEKLLKNYNFPTSNGSVASSYTQDDRKSFIELGMEVEDTGDDEIYDKYDFSEHKPQVGLPIFDYRQRILKRVAANPVIILQGSTGCGKTTQVPQFILDDAYARRQRVNIIVTQPRRIAAIDIAKRVCAERKWTMGDIVGYQVGLRRESSDDTRLMYCTTGVLLEKLIRDKSLDQFTHIILDEVHERDQDMDFLFIVVRKLLATTSPGVRIILMSATIDTINFSRYFMMPRNGDMIPSPIVKVEKDPLYEVKVYYLNDLQRLKIDVELFEDDPKIEDEMYKVALKLILVLERHTEPRPDVMKSSILVFLPGIHEISRMYEAISRWTQQNSHRAAEHPLHVVILHSSISREQQEIALKRSSPGLRKVILATNIAESSLTIRGVEFVIDFCLTKNLVTDTNTNFTRLQMDWASKNNCCQRAGRTGREMNGRVYRLIPKRFYEQLPQSAVPEMLRVSLETVVLRSKSLDMGTPASILALAMDTPRLTDIQNTILVLKELGGMLQTVNGKFNLCDGDLTFMGRIMTALPVDIRVSRLIIFGYCFNVLEEAIIIGAGLTIQNIFSTAYFTPLPAYLQKLRWSDGSGSDLIAILNAYRVWRSQIAHERHTIDRDQEKTWANRYFVDYKMLNEMHVLIDELNKRLSRFNIVQRDACWTDQEKSIVLKIVIAGAFYPNYYQRSPQDEHEFERDAFVKLGGRDPCNTVYFAGFQQKFIGPLYSLRIKEMFKPFVRSLKDDIAVAFDPTAEKIYVTFRPKSTKTINVDDDFVTRLPGRVSLEVYLALKLGKSDRFQALQVMKPKDAIELAEKRGLGRWENGAFKYRETYIKHIDMICIPKMLDKNVYGTVTHIESCDKFWFQPASEEVLLKQIHDELNNHNSNLQPFDVAEEIKVGQVLAAPFTGPKGVKSYYRAKVTQMKREPMEVSFKVWFLDYGNSATVKFDDLRQLKGIAAQFATFPPRIFECRLAEIQPPFIQTQQSSYSREACEFFEQLAYRREICAEIFSVSNGITNVFLFASDTFINQLLIEQGFATRADENYMSIKNHVDREQRQLDTRMDFHGRADEMTDDLRRYLLDDFSVEDVQPPPKDKCYINIKLRGPISPLETTLYSTIESGHNKQITIDPLSVNSILLDSDPQDGTQKFLVAASVSDSAQRLTVRNTTLMPNIPGLPVLVALLFCPQMRLLRDTKKTRYVALLAGLGYDPGNWMPMYAEHDLRMYLDTEITPQDLEIINQIRYCIDQLLLTVAGHDVPVIPESSRHELTIKIKDLVIKLLSIDRKAIEPRYDRTPKWTDVDIDDADSDVYDLKNLCSASSIFPMHTATILHPIPPDDIFQLGEHCKELHELSKMDIMKFRPRSCLLCDAYLETIPLLRLHLHTRLHRDRESQIAFKK